MIMIIAETYAIFQNESKRYRFQYHSQGGKEDPERLCERLVRCVRHNGREMLEKSGFHQNQRDRRSNKTLLFASVRYILA